MSSCLGLRTRSTALLQPIQPLWPPQHLRASPRLAKKRVSDQVASATGKEPWHVEMEKSVESAYSGAVAQASSRFNEALKLTDSARNAVYPTQGVLESISSVASSRLSEAQAEATKQYADITGHYFFSC